MTKEIKKYVSSYINRTIFSTSLYW